MFRAFRIINLDIIPKDIFQLFKLSNMDCKYCLKKLSFEHIAEHLNIEPYRWLWSMISDRK